MSAWNNSAARGGSVDNGDEREAKPTLSLNQVVVMPVKHCIQRRLIPLHEKKKKKKSYDTLH